MALLIALIIFLSFYSVSAKTNFQETQSFIIGINNELKPSNFSTLDHWYSSILKSLHFKNSIPSHQENSTAKILHVYKTVFHGFSAILTQQEVWELKNRPEILHVFRDHSLKIHTTRTPHFLELDTTKAFTGLMNASNYGSDVIIGVVDSGIWPELHSFNDDHMDPIPSRWKGECQEGEQFPKTTCNKKLIGARYFTHDQEIEGDFKSPRDSSGHGTHTASTAAGSTVNNASCLGFAGGQAHGIAPKARIAVYKVCWADNCLKSNVLAGFDSAVNDGVDILSVSLGNINTKEYWKDALAIGAFGAMERGVFISTSAGNDGPHDRSITNGAPWITTTGASTLDRTFPADLLLADGTSITGSSLYNGKGLSKKYFPLIYAGNASINPGNSNCPQGSLKAELVRGKIVVCDFGFNSPVQQGLAVKDAGGVGVVIATPTGADLLAYPYLIPGLAITANQKFSHYLKTEPKAAATMIFRGTNIGLNPAPVVASFSSRGPNIVALNVLKPDLIAPGVNILAAWANRSPSQLPEDPRRTNFNIISGTSMSCPHISGIAALLKGAHPDWSPASIKSALMTTAYTHYDNGKPLLDNKDLKAGDAWSIGAGHVHPTRAFDPGLVYNITAEDYVDFLCASGLTSEQMKTVLRRTVECSSANKTNPWDLNYPAISVAFNSSELHDLEVVVKRTVTNVGNEGTYTVTVTNPVGVAVSVDPQQLVFNMKGEQRSYTVKISTGPAKVRAGEFLSRMGRLSWTDGSHQVASPIAVTWIA